MYTRDRIHFMLPIKNQMDFVFGNNQDESSDDEGDKAKVTNSPEIRLRLRTKELTRSSSGSSFDELNLEEESDKNV